MNEMQIDGIGFNLDALDGIPLKDFIKMHQAFYPNLTGKEKDAALTNTYKILRGKDATIKTAAEIPESADQSVVIADAIEVV